MALLKRPRSTDGPGSSGGADFVFEGASNMRMACTTSWLQDESYASILTIVIVASMSLGLGIFCFGITSAFFHTFLNPDEPPHICVWHPEEYYRGITVLWRWKIQVYGLRTAPRDWQVHLASHMIKSGF